MAATDTKAPGTDTPAKKQGILKYLDNTIGDEGVRTDVKITLTDETLVKLIAAAVAATALSTVAYFFIKTIYYRLNPKP